MAILGVGPGQDFEVSELSFAAFNGHIDQVRKLIDEGASLADVDRQGHTAAYYALRGNQRAAAKLIFERGGTASKDLQYLLNRAAYLGVSEAILKLIDAGARVSGQEGSRKQTPLTSAIEGRSREALQSLIRFGADVNASGLDDFPPLHLAAKFGDAGMISQLLKAGAKVNGLDVAGFTALRRAQIEQNVDLREEDRKEVITLLMNNGGVALPAPSLIERVRGLFGRS